MKRTVLLIVALAALFVWLTAAGTATGAWPNHTLAGNRGGPI